MNRIYVNVPGRKVSVVGYFMPIGSRDEPNHIKGISHFMEHMMFKGTHKISKEEIARRIEHYGADFNAYTGREGTFYRVRVCNEYVNEVQPILKEMVSHPAFPSDEMEKERDVILQEYYMYRDDPSSYLWEIYTKHVFLPSSGLHLPTIGTEDTIKAISPSDLTLWKFKAPITEVIIGDVDDYCDYVYGNRFDPETICYDSTRVIEERSDIEQTQVLVTGLYHTDNVLREQTRLALLGEIVGGMSGRLFANIREKYGLAYRVYFSYQIYQGGTVQWFLVGGIEQSKLDLFVEAGIAELARSLTAEEISDSLIKSKGSRAMFLDRISGYESVLFMCLTAGIDHRELLVADREVQYAQAKEDLSNWHSQIPFGNYKVFALIPSK